MEPTEAGLEALAALVDASPVLVCVTDVGGRVRSLNQAGRDLVGLPDGLDVSATIWDDYRTVEGVDHHRQVEQPALLADGQWVGQTTLRDWRGGPPIPVLTTSILVRDVATGEPTAITTSQRDLRLIRAQATDWVTHQQDRQRALLQDISDLVVVVDPDLRVLYVNPAAERRLGHRERGGEGQHVLDLLHADDRATARRALDGLLGGCGDRPVLRVRVRCWDHTYAWFETSGTNLLDEPGVHGLVLTGRNIDDAVLAEQHRSEMAHILELIALERPVPQVLDAVTEWVEMQLLDVSCTVLLLDELDGRPVLRDGASGAMPDVYRLAVDGSPATPNGSPCAVAVCEGHPVVVENMLDDPRWASLADLARECDVTSCWSYPIVSPATGATLGSFALYRPTAGLPTLATDELVARANHLVGIALDRQRLLEQLSHEATHDPLTGLPNRAWLISALTAAMARGTDGEAPMPAVLFFDLDRLKVLNDSLGHDVGDSLLVRVAARLTRALAPHDRVARFGGDEFVVLSVRSHDAASAGDLAEKVLRLVAEPVELEGRVIVLSASLGVVLTGAGQQAVGVLRDADIAMYRAKQRGGDRYELFGSRMRQRAFDRLDLEGQIRTGLRQNQFRLFFQPIVDLVDGSVVGTEALVRWQHPDRGLLGPDSFLQLAEETGLIIPLGAWALQEAAMVARRWRDEIGDQPFTMSVNVAAQQLSSPELVPMVRDCVSSLQPWTLGLELTESTLMEDTSAVLHSIRQLAKAGGQIAIDDFGTGFSSLSYLARLPVQRLKIDRSFVQDLDRGEAALTVVRTVLSLAEQLRLIAVAEGIETEEQRQLLLSVGCRYAQGYLFSPPVEDRMALTMLRRGI